MRGAGDCRHEIHRQQQIQRIEARDERLKCGMSAPGEQQREEQPGERVATVAIENSRQHTYARQRPFTLSVQLAQDLHHEGQQLFERLKACGLKDTKCSTRPATVADLRVGANLHDNTLGQERETWFSMPFIVPMTV